MIYTVYVSKPHRALRDRCRRTDDGRYVLFEGESNRRDVMKMAREAAEEADAVHVVWRTARTFQRGWPVPSLVPAFDERTRIAARN